MAWQTPKTDWDTSDYYNYSDLNRVENNTSEIADLIATYATRPGIVSTNTSRTKTSIEYYDSLNRIENNISLLKDAITEPENWETLKTDWVSVVEIFDYSDANRLENNLSELYTLVNRKIDNLLYPESDLIDDSLYPAGSVYDVIGVEA